MTIHHLAGDHLTTSITAATVSVSVTARNSGSVGLLVRRIADCEAQAQGHAHAGLFAGRTSIRVGGRVRFTYTWLLPTEALARSRHPAGSQRPSGVS